MQIVMGTRRSGKTRAAVRWLADAPEGTTRVMFFSWHAAARTAYEMAVEMGLDVEEHQFRVYRDGKSLRGLNAEIGFDEIENIRFEDPPCYDIKFATATISENNLGL